MNEMKERMALAMVDHWYRLAGSLPWDKMTEGERNNWRGQAEAALGALVRPTEPMLAAGRRAFGLGTDEQWAAMINEALK